jgi:hypothetical protein
MDDLRPRFSLVAQQPSQDVADVVIEPNRDALDATWYFSSPITVDEGIFDGDFVVETTAGPESPVLLDAFGPLYVILTYAHPPIAGPWSLSTTAGVTINGHPPTVPESGLAHVI